MSTVAATRREDRQRGLTPSDCRRGVHSLLELLRCPACLKGALRMTEDSELRCVRCGQAYPVIDGLPFLFPPDAIEGFVRIDAESRRSSAPERVYSKGAAQKWREYRIGELMPPSEEAPLVLLQGTGDGGEQPHLQALGFQTVGFDINRSPGTDFLADAHQLPVADAAFDVVLSTQVLEHLHCPWAAVEEVGRVLRPGGYFIGSVAFLKGYHSSYFHMTHRGVSHLMERAGLQVEHLGSAQSLTYSLYGALLPVGSRSFRRAVLGLLDTVFAGARTLAWTMTRREDPGCPSDRFGTLIPLSFKEFDRLRFAPAVVFRGRKIRPMVSG